MGFATNVLAGAVCVLLAAIMFYAGMLYHDIMSYPPWHDQGNPLNLIIHKDQTPATNNTTNSSSYPDVEYGNYGPAYQGSPSPNQPYPSEVSDQTFYCPECGAEAIILSIEPYGPGQGCIIYLYCPECGYEWDEIIGPGG
ncbi:MAG: hypothetical protein QMC86_06535 [Methanothermobacter sp.]|nr:hypothetical protein [Methanothermobacter sp.]